MTFTLTNNSSSIFEGGKLKPGTYKIQNIFSETFLDVEVHSRELLCRPSLKEGMGLWEIKPFGAGYTIQRVEPGKPEQFCAAMAGTENTRRISVSTYPVAWKIELVIDEIHSGHEYVRFYWGTTNKIWNIPNGTSTRVEFWVATPPYPWFIWRLIPMRVEGRSTHSGSSSETLGSGSPPSYDGNTTGQPSARTQQTEFQRDDFGTIVTEVTTVTTHKRYRVEDA